MSQLSSERRHYPRYSAPQLHVSLLSVTTKNTSENQASKCSDATVELTSLDFNHLGMSVQSLQHFNIGDILHLKLFNKSTPPEEIRGFVCNRAQTETGYRCGLHFLIEEMSNNQGNFATPESLLAIENKLL